MKKKLTLLFSICISTVFAQNCNNIGFEDGTAGWTCKSGQYGISPGPCTPVTTIATPGCINGGDNSQLDPINGKLRNRHTIMTNTTMTDPNTGTGPRVNCVAPGNLFPSGVNRKSFRLGNGLGGGFDPANPTSLFNTAAIAESISFTFQVDASNAGLTYMYAVFLNEAKTQKHNSPESPRFIVKITTSTGTVINCGLYNVDASEDGGSKDFITGGPGPNEGEWKYRNWTKVALDLTAYIGSSVTIEFITADCLPASLPSGGQCSYNPGGHSAYAYIDLYCTPLEIVSPPVCANQPTVQLCGPDGYSSYQWDPAAPGIQPPYNQKCVTIKNPKAGDQYTVTMQSIAGACPTKTTIVLKGSDFTVADASTCPDSPIKLTVKPTTGALTDYEWKWEPQQYLDRYDIAEPTFTPGADITYTITMIDKNIANCNQVKTMKVSVGTGFTVSTAGTTICEGDEATLTATGADTYTWEPGTLTGTTITVKPTSTTTYTVTGKSNNSSCGGDATATALVTVNQKPIITVSDQTICLGESAALTGSISGGTTKGTWVGGDGKFTPDRNTLTASYKPSAAEEAAGTVTLTLESEAPAAPCVKDSKQMVITIVPAVTSDAGPDQTICIGESVTLAGIFGGAATGGSWSGGTGTYTPADTDPNAVYKPSAAEENTGKVTLKFTVANGSNSTCPGGMDEMTIYIDKMPTVSAGADQTICFGETATLGGSIGGSATTGTWTGGTGTFSPNNTTLTAKYTPSAAEMIAGTVILTLTTDAPGKCPAKDSQTTITINPVAVVDAGPDQKICAGGTVTLAGIYGGGAISGSWSGGKGVYAPNSSTANATYTPSTAEQAAGKVTLTFTTNDPPGPCPAVNDEMTISIDQLPIAVAGEAKPICDGQVIKLNGSVEVATGGTWSGGKGTFTKDNKDLTGTYKPTAEEIAAGKVTLILTSNTNGLCPADVDSAIFIINPNPVIQFGVDVPKACPPHCVNFFDSTTVGGGTNIVKWEWNFSIDSSKVKDPKGVCFERPGFYDVSLTATSNAGCKSTLKKDKYIETYPTPVAAFTPNPREVSLYDPTINFYNESSADVVSWKWDLGDGTLISPNIQNPLHQYEIGVSGTYKVTLLVENSYGCLDSTFRFVEVLPEFTFFIPNAFTPNRNDGINDTFFGKGVGIVEYHIWIFDRWGNMIFNTTDINTGWDGRANNGQEIAQQDVYVWKVQLKDVFGKKHDYIGTVTLSR